jgi:hypothetical protein
MCAKAANQPRVKSLTLDAAADARVLQLRINGSKSNGRPVKMSPRIFIKVCQLIEAGGIETNICEAFGVQYGTMWLHCSRKPAWKRRLEKAREIRKAVWHEMHCQNIMKQAPKNVVASLWWLERNFPEQYALRTVNRQINSHELVLDRVTPEQLIADVRLAQQVANERVQLPSLAPGADGQD